jgi:RNA polymerase sigma-70 factor (ECF subfamily)
MLSDPQDAQDAAQETFLRVYQKLPGFNGQYQLGAWITRIATNVCVDRLRARSRTPSDAAPNDVLEDRVEAEPEASPEEALLRSVEGMQVHETLASLSPLHRRVITMRDLEGRDYREIASSLGVPEARARVLLHRARKGFKKSWASAGIFLGLPMRWLERVRRLRDPGVADPLINAAGTAGHATHAAAANANLAASCSQVVQHCGGVISEKIAAAATAALVGVGVTATGGTSVALSREPDLRPAPAVVQEHPLREPTEGVVERAVRVATRTVEAATEVASTMVVRAGDVVDGGGTVVADTGGSVPTDTGPAPETDDAVEDSEPTSAPLQPSLSAPGIGSDPGSSDSAGLGDGTSQEAPAVVSDPVVPADPAASPTPSPQPSVPHGGPVTVPPPETTTQEPGTPANDAISPSAAVDGVGPGGGAGSQPIAGSQPTAPESPGAQDTLPGLAPSSEPSPTPTTGPTPVEDTLEVPGAGGLAD